MPERKNKSKWIWWGSGILVVAIIAGGIVAIVNAISGAEEAETETQEVVKVKTAEQKDEADTEEAVEKPKVKQYDGDDEEEDETADLTGVVTYAAVNGDNLMIRVNIDQFLASGTCELVLRKDGVSIYNTTTDIMSVATTSTCNGFDIPAAELESGEMTMIIYLNADGRTGEITGEVAI